MSIINDALKKTQASLNKAKKAPDEKQNSPSNQSTSNIYEKLYKAQNDQQNGLTPEAGQKKKASDKEASKKSPKIFPIAVFFLLCALGGFFFIARPQSLQSFLHSIKKKSISSKPPAVRKVPKKRKYKAGELVLNGTSLIDEKRVALINDEIYETGEIINGMKITSIDLNKVELRNDEETITLRDHEYRPHTAT